MAYEIKVGEDVLFPDTAIGIKLPIVGTGGTMFPQSYSTFEQAISNLKNLILTERGERLYQPLFGTRVRHALFEQNTQAIKDMIKTDITDSVAFWLPYISIIRLDINTVVDVTGNKDEHGVTVELLVAVNGQKAEKPITFLITSNSIEELYATT